MITPMDIHNKTFSRGLRGVQPGRSGRIPAGAGK